MVDIEYQLLMVSPTIISVVAFVVMGYEAPQLTTAANVFAALAYFQQLREPILMFPKSMGFIVEAYVAAGRIDDFLCAAELTVQPERIPFDRTQPVPFAIEVVNASFAWHTDSEAVYLPSDAATNLISGASARVDCVC